MKVLPQVSDDAESAITATTAFKEQQQDECEIENTEASREHDPDSPDESRSNVCILCQKKRKKHNGQEQQLKTCTTADSINGIIFIANEVGDEQLINRITELSGRNEVIIYHNICKVNLRNAQTLQKTSKAEKTEWHKTRDVHKLAFDEICSFISHNVIDKRNCYFLSYLNALYSEYFANIDTNKTTTEPCHLESRLLKRFPKMIDVVTINGKKMVKPYVGVVIKNDLIHWKKITFWIELF